MYSRWVSLGQMGVQSSHPRGFRFQARSAASFGFISSSISTVDKLTSKKEDFTDTKRDMPLILVIAIVYRNKLG